MPNPIERRMNSPPRDGGLERLKLIVPDGFGATRSVGTVEMDDHNDRAGGHSTFF
jgi:hypothetical protein